MDIINVYLVFISSRLELGRMFREIERVAANQSRSRKEEDDDSPLRIHSIFFYASSFVDVSTV